MSNTDELKTSQPRDNCASTPVAKAKAAPKAAPKTTAAKAAPKAATAKKAPSAADTTVTVSAPNAAQNAQSPAAPVKADAKVEPKEEAKTATATVASAPNQAEQNKAEPNAEVKTEVKHQSKASAAANNAKASEDTAPASANAAESVAASTNASAAASAASADAAKAESTDSAAKEAASDRSKAQANAKAKSGGKKVMGSGGEEDVEHAGFDPDQWQQLLDVKYWPSWFALGILAVLAYVPNRIRDLFAILLAYPLSLINIRFKKVVFANLRTAFPEKSESDYKQLYRKLLTHAIITGFAFGEGVFLPRFMVERSWIVKNPEVLKAALDDKRPIIFCVPHTFSLDRGGLYLTANRHPMFGVANDQSNPVFNWFMNYQRVIYGGTMHTRAAGFRSILKALKQGRHCYFLCDEDLGDDVPNVFTDFYGVPKAMVDTLPKMARLTKSQVVVLTITYSISKARYELEFTRLDNFPSNDVVADLNRVNKVFEQHLSGHIEQYMWFLRLFKSRPDLRYFTDCYADCHGTKDANSIKVDYYHRRVPLFEPQIVWDGYVPPKDYSEIAAKLKAEEEAKKAKKA
ncbi:LpxL/LpxP family acyltransferase [Anaerobiospirillum succiniciproducens]|uniref:LpxL/LpxP family acyltransferase n=1 Tax=Anaerobiospirillum succiniciproducens TaxID=13335 RepID=UPI003F8CBFEC